MSRTRVTVASPSGWLAAALLAGLTLGAYANAFTGAFVFDDLLRIRGNPRLLHLWPPWAPLLGTSRPLVEWTLALNHAWSGEHTWSYHALNVAIHVLAALALFALTRRTLERAGGRGRAEASLLALAIAALWAVHPLDTQAVTYIIQRSESLMALFLLLMLIAVERSAGARRPGRWQIAAVAGALLGTASKPVMVVAPLVALLYDRCFLAGSFRGALAARRWMYAGLAATWLCAALLLRAAPADYAPSAGFGLHAVTPLGYLATEPGVILHYLRLTFWPQPLVIDYGWPLARGAGAIVPPALVVGTLLAVAIAACVRRPAPGFLGAAFFLILAPTSSFVPIADPIFEHRMYLPLAVLVALLVLGADALLRRMRAPRAAGIALAAIVAVALALATSQRNRAYADSLTLWTDTVAKRPGNARAHNNLGKALDDAGRTDEALAEYREAARLDPGMAWAHCNLGAALARRGERDAALAELALAERLDARLPEAPYNRGRVLADLGRNEEAATAYAAALTENPDYPEARCNLGVALARLGHLDEALRQFRLAIQLRPDYVEAHFDLGHALALTGARDEAAQELRAALALNPEFEPAHAELERLGAR